MSGCRLRPSGRGLRRCAAGANRPDGAAGRATPGAHRRVPGQPASQAVDRLPRAGVPAEPLCQLGRWRLTRH